MPVSRACSDNERSDRTLFVRSFRPPVRILYCNKNAYNAIQLFLEDPIELSGVVVGNGGIEVVGMVVGDEVVLVESLLEVCDPAVHLGGLVFECERAPITIAIQDLSKNL